jgi:hypothetical protein
VQSWAADDPEPVLQFDCGFVAVKHVTTACKFSGVVHGNSRRESALTNTVARS